MEFPDGKRYNTAVGYYKRVYGERLQKLVLDAGFSCPNRDGTVGFGGCTYCDNAAFHPGYSTPGKTLAQQIDEGIEFHRIRYRNTTHYLAYFQAYSNTYAPIARLRQLYSEALAHPSVVGLVIGTRPDCVDDEKLDYLAELQEQGHVIQLELGIESCYDSILEHINRGHDFDCARNAVEAASSRGLRTCAHFILGLPGETRGMMLDSCDAISSLPLHSVKFHQLQIVKGTAMEREYAEHPERFEQFSLDEYLDFMTDMLERLRPDLYIDRVAGEVPPRFVGESRWGMVRNFQILHMLDERMEKRDARQGRLYSKK